MSDLCRYYVQCKGNIESTSRHYVHLLVQALFGHLIQRPYVVRDLDIERNEIGKQ